MTPSPQRGEIWLLDLDPTRGHEQAGRRPAMVLSPKSYNSKTGLAILCPITNRIKGYPFEVPLPDGFPISGGILSDQVKSLDWRQRNAELICVLPSEIIAETLLKLNTLLSQ